MQNFKRDQKILSGNQLCEIFKVSYQAVYAWKKMGLPHIKIGNRSLYDAEEVVQWMEQNSDRLRKADPSCLKAN